MLILAFLPVLIRLSADARAAVCGEWPLSQAEWGGASGLDVQTGGCVHEFGALTVR